MTASVGVSPVRSRIPSADPLHVTLPPPVASNERCGIGPCIGEGQGRLAFNSKARRPLVRRTSGRQHPRIRIHPAQVDPRPGKRSRASQDHQLSPPNPDGQRRMESLPGRAGRHLGDRQRILRPEADGRRSERRRTCVRCRELVRSMGGAEKCNSFTKFYFACLGQISFDACPAIPPEIVLLPKWFYFNLYHVSAWTRTMILPLGIVTTYKPVRNIPADLRIDELYSIARQPTASASPPHGCPRTGAICSSASTSCSRSYNKRPLQPPAPRAMKNGRAVAARASRRLRGPGRDLSADGLHPDRLPNPRLLRRSSARAACSQAPARFLCRSRQRRDPHSALLLARLGHRPGAARDGRGGIDPAKRRRPARLAMAAEQGMQDRQRLGEELPRRRGRRMVLRI